MSNGIVDITNFTDAAFADLQNQIFPQQSRRQKNGIQIIKDDFSVLLKRAEIVFPGGGLPNKLWQAIIAQLIRDNDLLFNKQQYYENGVKKKWLDWNMGKGHVLGGTTKTKGGKWKRQGKRKMWAGLGLR